MTTHPRAKLGLAARHQLCVLIEGGLSIRAAARRFNVSPATAHKHWHRWKAASATERGTLACLHDRPSRPHHSPRMLDALAQERICEVRRHTGWGPRLIAGVTGHPHSTVHRTLRRHGISRPPRPQREAAVRYEWPCPGDLLHMDTKRYARFSRPGHAKTGNRFTSRAEKLERVGYEFAHSIVDDHSRLAYSELHADERGATVAAFTRRALEFFERMGIRPKRLMTDNAFVYTKSSELRGLLAGGGSATSPLRPAGHRPTAKSSASSRRWHGSGPTASPTAAQATASAPCHTGCATTTSSDPTQDRGPAADQPRSQRVRAGQLAARARPRP
jgi:transposase